MKTVATTLAFTLLSTLAARADDAPPPPYSLPWNLRPAAVVDVVRLDTVSASYDDTKGNSGGHTLLPMLTLGFKINDKLGTFLRAGWVDNDPPTGDTGNGYINPAVGVLYLMKPRKDLRVGLFLGATVPTGQGGGNDPNPSTKAAVGAGVLARSAMDNAMFGVNDWSILPGVDVAYVNHGFTAQWEATVIQATRVRGDEVQPDKHKTNFTTGVHLGYFINTHFSLAGEVRYQRFISTPKAVEANEKLRDNLSAAFGPRFHVHMGGKKWFRPGISYATGLDGPIDDQDYGIVQIDLPFYY